MRIIVQPPNKQGLFQADGSMKMTKFKCKPCGKFFLHHKSHLNDSTLQPRKLETSENIFDIIMPWIPELKKEEEEKVKEMIKLGLLEAAALKKFKTAKGEIAKKFLQPKLFEKPAAKEDSGKSSAKNAAEKKKEEP